MNPNFTDVWQRLWQGSGGALNDWLAAKDEEKLLPLFKSVFGEDATLATYDSFHASWRSAVDAGERMAELVVVYGIGVLSLPPGQQEMLRLAIPYARGCLAAVAMETAAASSPHGIPGGHTFRALTNRDEAEAKRAYSEALTRRNVGL